MKKTANRIALAICFCLSISGAAVAQAQEKLKVGLAMNMGRDFFEIKTEDFLAANIRKESISSAFSAGGGIWLEKFLYRRFSLIPKIEYHLIKVNNNVVEGSVAAIPGPIKESHHSVVLGMHVRYYIPLTDDLRIFTDAGIELDKMVHFRFQHRHLVSTNTMPDYFGFANPGLSGSVGFNKGRWALSVQYHRYLAKSESQIIHSETGAQMMKRAVSRQNTLVRLSYTLWQNNAGH